MLDHQVNIQGLFRRRGNEGHVVEGHGEIRHKAAVHDIDMKGVDAR